MLDFNVAQLIEEHPLIHNMISLKEVFWNNPNIEHAEESIENLNFGLEEVRDAEARLERFAPYLMKVFPETVEHNGIIESPLTQIPELQSYLNKTLEAPVEGILYLKEDNLLPVSGSIKARGGIYEVLKQAESIAVEEGLLQLTDDYTELTNQKFKDTFSKYTIVVGSTGNLGLSIGIISAALGFKVIVHMSSDAKKWKKSLLREKGVQEVEHESDYSIAVKEGRNAAEGNPQVHFVDDENSKDLFFGYAVAAFRLERQLSEKNIKVDSEHPLFVYLPCGVGGGPGGVAFGLKLVFGDNVHCFFAEPTHSPCMLLGMMTELHDKISVQDIGIDNQTEADGLAVGRPSGFVGSVMSHLISGVYTVEDENMFKLLSALMDIEGIFIEPSSQTSLSGPVKLFNDRAGKEYLKAYGMTEEMLDRSTHIAWGTGGNMVPDEQVNAYYEIGKGLQI